MLGESVYQLKWETYISFHILFVLLKKKGRGCIVIDILSIGSGYLVFKMIKCGLAVSGW